MTKKSHRFIHHSVLRIFLLMHQRRGQSINFTAFLILISGSIHTRDAFSSLFFFAFNEIVIDRQDRNEMYTFISDNIMKRGLINGNFHRADE